MTTFEKFIPTVQSSWQFPINGNAQFQLCHKLRFLKANLKRLSKDIIGKERINLDKAREDLLLCQQERDRNPTDIGLMLCEKEKLKLYFDASRIEEDIARQKSRIQWLEGGDKNSKYFHNSIKQRRNIKKDNIFGPT